VSERRVGPYESGGGGEKEHRSAGCFDAGEAQQRTHEPFRNGAIGMQPGLVNALFAHGRQG
jgi:hypothetical protein